MAVFFGSLSEGTVECVLSGNRLFGVCVNGHIMNKFCVSTTLITNIKCFIELIKLRSSLLRSY